MKLFFVLAAVASLILDSPTAAEAAWKSLELCGKTLIPGLFPLFVLSGMLVPELKGLRISLLSRLLGFPGGSEGIFLLGCAGGFPVGAVAIAQGVREGGLSNEDGERMLGISSFCGPSFLFGVIGTVFSLGDGLAIFLMQLETAMILGAFWPNPSQAEYRPAGQSVSLPEAVKNALQSMLSVCAWVVLAGVLSGLLQKWLFPMLPAGLAVFCTGLLELTNGVFSLSGLSREVQFLFCTVFATFGGISVLLQIAGFALQAGLSMKCCILQKTAQALLSALLAGIYLQYGSPALLIAPILLAAKIAVEISGRMVYNVPRKEG